MTVCVAAVPSTRQAYDRVFNFSAGPACLPLDVLKEAQADMLNWKGSGASLAVCLFVCFVMHPCMRGEKGASLRGEG